MSGSYILYLRGKKRRQTQFPIKLHIYDYSSCTLNHVQAAKKIKTTTTTTATTTTTTTTKATKKAYETKINMVTAKKDPNGVTEVLKIIFYFLHVCETSMQSSQTQQ